MHTSEEWKKNKFHLSSTVYDAVALRIFIVLYTYTHNLFRFIPGVFITCT